MPKSKRQKLVSLTKTAPKNRDDKERLIEEIQKFVETHQHIFIFSLLNSRSSYMKDVKTEWKSSRFFFGKNKVMAKALGTTPEEELRPNLSKLANLLQGEVGLLFTNEEPSTVQEYFQNFKKQDYARSGVEANQLIVIPAGPVYRGEGLFPHNMEPQLRSLGMPTFLDKGIVTIHNDYTVCKPGDVLTPNQAQLLKLFLFETAEFQVKLTHHFCDGKLDAL